jgi:hypothetical protein
VPLCGKLEHKDSSLCLQPAPGSQLRITAYKKAPRKDWVRNYSTLIQFCCFIHTILSTGMMGLGFYSSQSAVSYPWAVFIWPINER